MIINLEDVWDRNAIKALIDFLKRNTSLEELHMTGVDKNIFELGDFISTLEESQTLRKLVITPLPAGNNNTIMKGLQIDGQLEEKLRKIVETNRRLSIHGVAENAVPLVVAAKE